jgi:hypothetical protein
MPSLIDDFLGGIFLPFCEKILCQIFFFKIKKISKKSTQLSTILKGA